MPSCTALWSNRDLAHFQKMMNGCIRMVTLPSCSLFGRPLNQEGFVVEFLLPSLFQPCVFFKSISPHCLPHLFSLPSLSPLLAIRPHSLRMCDSCVFTCSWYSWLSPWVWMLWSGIVVAYTAVGVSLVSCKGGRCWRHRVSVQVLLLFPARTLLPIPWLISLIFFFFCTDVWSTGSPQQAVLLLQNTEPGDMDEELARVPGLISTSNQDPLKVGVLPRFWKPQEEAKSQKVLRKSFRDCL